MLYTIGHSTLPADDFRDALDAAGVTTVVDTRSHPTSYWEQYRREELEEWLAGRYEWWPQLGGWDTRHALLKDALHKVGVDLEPYLHGHFPKQRIAANRDRIDEEVDGTPTWQSVGLHDYQFFQIQPEYLLGMTDLLRRCQTDNLAVMCSEACWWKCHRSMIADCAVFAGHDAQHIMPRFRKVKQPRCVVTLHSHKAVPDLDKRLAAYHPVVIRAWDKWRKHYG